MSKKNKAGLILLAGVLTFGAVGALASCGETTPTEPDKPDKPDVPDKPDTPDTPTNPVKALTIANKEALTAEWRVEEEDRDITLTLDPTNLNIGELIDNGDITVTSSNPEVIAAFNLKLKAISAGKATITVEAGDIKDSVEIEVLARDVIECTSIKDVVSKGFDAEGKWAPVKKTHTVKAAFVCIEPKGNAVITDGTDFLICYGMQGANELKMGDNVMAEGELSHYFGTIQLKSGKLIKLDTNDITVPEAVKFDKKALDAHKKTGTANNNGPISATDFYQPTYGTVTLKYTGKAAGQFIDKGKVIYEVRFNKCGEDMDAIIKTLGYGDIIDVTGGLIGWNGGYNYFNLIPTDIQVTKKAIQPTKVEFALEAQKQFAPVDLSKGITLTPSDADADVTFEIKDDAKILQQVSNKVLATKAGTVTVTPVANGTLKGAPVELTFTAEKETNLYTTAAAKTIVEMNALDAKVAHKDALYLVEGKVTAAEDSEYGNVTLEDEAGNKFETYGMGNSYLNINLDATSGQVAYYSNPKVFNKELLGKEFKVGDTIQILVFADCYKGNASNKTVFLKRTAEGTIVEPEAPTIEGTKVTYTWTKDCTTTDGLTATHTAGDVKITIAKADGSNDVVTKYDEIRLYGGQTITIESVSGKAINGIVLTTTKGKADKLVAEGYNSTTASSIVTLLPATTAAKSATISNTDASQVRITTFDVYFAA